MAKRYVIQNAKTKLFWRNSWSNKVKNWVSDLNLAGVYERKNAESYFEEELEEKSSTSSGGSTTSQVISDGGDGGKGVLVKYPDFLYDITWARTGIDCYSKIMTACDGDDPSKNCQIYKCQF
jgi:hypothetical protein